MGREYALTCMLNANVLLCEIGLILLLCKAIYWLTTDRHMNRQTDGQRGRTTEREKEQAMRLHAQANLLGWSGNDKLSILHTGRGER